MCSDTELYDQNGGLIRAAESWSKEYKKDPDTFAKLVKNEAKMERLLYGYFKDLAERVPDMINWAAYNDKANPVQAADKVDISAIFSDSELDYEDSLIMKLMFDPIQTAAELGVKAGEKVYKKPLGDSQVSDAVQEAARKQIAYLVGKRVDSSGNIVDNPRAEYSITESTRQYIRESIRTSISLGETQQEATARLQTKIKDPERAAKIASTESVNSYQGGLFNFAQESGAVAKEWQTIAGACPTCEGNASEGAIPLNENFISDDDAPSAHPYDRCGLRYIYQEELDAAKQ